MITTTNRSLHDHIPEIKKAQYHIDPTAAVHITRILRNMYENPVRAVVREYLANAYDAHNQIGQKKLITVDAPTRMAPTFRVRDYGPGLSVEEVEKLLLGYGASGEQKRSSNEQIGGFGIGCKCAFAVSDTFTYVSWHAGKKQTWLCQLDERDMGEAKLISHVDSKEPSGLMVEIPVSASQLPLFERQLKQVPLFFRQPINISGTKFEPEKDIGIKLRGQMDGKFADSEWMFYTLKNSLTNTIDYDMVVIMGDLWYPVEKSFLDEMADSRLMKIIRPTNVRGYRSGSDRQFRCAIRAPIGTFSLAPTRESLQYDTATRKLLKEAFKAIEDGITKISQKAVDDCPDIWAASAKALALQDTLMYQTGKDKSGEPTFEWRGKTYTFPEAVGIPAAADSTGAKVLLAARDIRDGADYYYSLSNGNLKVRHFVINADADMSETSKTGKKDRIPYKTITAEVELAPLLGKSGGDEDDDDDGGLKSRPVYALLQKSTKAGPKKVLKYVFTTRVPVYTLGPKDSAEFYSRRYLIANELHVPDKSGFMLVIQGTPEQQAAFLNLYPWLNKDVKPLPLIKREVKEEVDANGNKVEVPVEPARSFKSAENMLQFNEKDKNLKQPSASWKTLKALPDDAKYFVYMEKFIPVHRCPKTVNGSTVKLSLSPSTQFTWLESMITLMRILENDDFKVYGFRALKDVIKPTSKLTPLPDALNAKLKEWFDPSTLGTHKLHGLHVLMRHGRDDNLFTTLGMAHDTVSFESPKKRKSDRWYYSRGTGDELIKMIREASARKRIAKLPATSEFKQMADMYWELTGLEHNTDKSLLECKEAMTAIKNAGTVKPEILFDAKAQLEPVMRKYAKPFLDLLAKVWQKYTVLPLLNDIPDDADGIEQFMDYIELVDKK